MAEEKERTNGRRVGRRMCHNYSNTEKQKHKERKKGLYQKQRNSFRWGGNTRSRHILFSFFSSIWRRDDKWRVLVRVIVSAVAENKKGL